jgi:hypothetical protein
LSKAFHGGLRRKAGDLWLTFHFSAAGIAPRSVLEPRNRGSPRRWPPAWHSAQSRGRTRERPRRPRPPKELLPYINIRAVARLRIFLNFLHNLVPRVPSRIAWPGKRRTNFFAGRARIGCVPADGTRNAPTSASVPAPELSEAQVRRTRNVSMTLKHPVSFV